MPRTYLTNEERELNRFSDVVRGELRRQNKRHKDLADELSISQVATTNKINGKTEWSLSEVIQTVRFLGIEYVFGRKE
jgi:hypothetical protein